jgi:hypothetical protein
MAEKVFLKIPAYSAGLPWIKESGFAVGIRYWLRGKPPGKIRKAGAPFL